MPLKSVHQNFTLRPWTIRSFHNPFFQFRVDNYFQDGRCCKWVLQNESWPIGEIFDWPIDCSSLKYENDILQLHKRKTCSKIVLWGVNMTATLWQCTCGKREIKLVDPSPRMQRAKSTVAFEPSEGAWIVKQLNCTMTCILYEPHTIYCCSIRSRVELKYILSSFTIYSPSVNCYMICQVFTYFSRIGIAVFRGNLFHCQLPSRVSVITHVDHAKRPLTQQLPALPICGCSGCCQWDLNKNYKR